MKISSEGLKLLKYLYDLDKSGVVLESKFLDEFFKNPSPKRKMKANPNADGPGRDLLRAMSSTSGPAPPKLIPGEPEETATEYLSRLGWVVIEGENIKLSKVGATLVELDSFEIAESSSESAECLFIKAEDRENYHKLMSEMASYRGGLMVDAYMDYDSLHELYKCNINEFLIGNDKKADVILDKMKKAPLEIKIFKSSELHDRYFIPSDNAKPVRMMGHSFNGLMKKPTVLISLPEDVSGALRSTYLNIKNESDLIYDGIQTEESAEDH